MGKKALCHALHTHAAAHPPRSPGGASLTSHSSLRPFVRYRCRPSALMKQRVPLYDPDGTYTVTFVLTDSPANDAVIAAAVVLVVVFVASSDSSSSLNRRRPLVLPTPSCTVHPLRASTAAPAPVVQSLVLTPDVRVTAAS